MCTPLHNFAVAVVFHCQLLSLAFQGRHPRLHLSNFCLLTGRRIVSILLLTNRGGAQCAFPPAAQGRRL